MVPRAPVSVVTVAATAPLQVVVNAASDSEALARAAAALRTSATAQSNVIPKVSASQYHQRQLPPLPRPYSTANQHYGPDPLRGPPSTAQASSAGLPSVNSYLSGSYIPPVGSPSGASRNLSVDISIDGSAQQQALPLDDLTRQWHAFLSAQYT